MSAPECWGLELPKETKVPKELWGVRPPRLPVVEVGPPPGGAAVTAVGLRGLRGLRSERLTSASAPL